MLGDFIDVIIVVLLLVAIGFGLILDRRVRRLTKALHDIKPTVDDFSIAVDRSEDTISAMRNDASSQTPPRPTPKVEPKVERPFGLPSFRSSRTETAQAAGLSVDVANVDGKADLVRSFFETARGRQA
ncbi:hypothetical protein FIU97_12375 [Roseivivax sp. THAF40]|nr:hypothetical protein FIU97_12375 [Roseivivax sp. THAF40]